MVPVNEIETLLRVAAQETERRCALRCMQVGDDHTEDCRAVRRALERVDAFLDEAF
jgi:hypothetical protein